MRDDKSDQHTHPGRARLRGGGDATAISTMYISVLAMAGVAVAACGGPPRPAVGEVRTVMMPPRPADCALEIIAVDAEDMMPGARFGAGGQYQMIGVVSVGLPRGTDVLAEEVRALVRPRACAMGGEVVSLLATGDNGHFLITGRSITTIVQTEVGFTVWGARAAEPASQRF